MCWILLGIFYFFCFFPSIPAWSVSVSNFGRSLLNLSLFVLLHLEVTLGISELMAASVGRVLSICLSYLNPTGIRKLAFSLSDSSLAAGLFLLYQSDTSRRIKMERWELECWFFFVFFFCARYCDGVSRVTMSCLVKSISAGCVTFVSDKNRLFWRVSHEL